MKKLFDFEITNFISVEAEEGTDPNALLDMVASKAAEMAVCKQLEFDFSNTFCPESGEYVYPNQSEEKESASA